jgi:saccharopine dehydrogenase-like NADP-dependent oxidoreductase
MKIAVLGAGAAGTAITRFLSQEKKVTAIRVLDRNGNALDELESSVNSSKIRVHRVAIDKEMSVTAILKGAQCIISALPFKHNYRVAKIALKAGIPYVDLGGDDDITFKQLSLYEKAREANIFMVPNSGFAPGLVNILAMHGFESFDSVDSIIIRAAGLPKDPIPPLNYHLSFSPVGLVNEYLNKVTVIENGELIEVDALDGYETCKLKSHSDLGPLEAFYTSGSATFIAKELEGKIKTLDFKTLRYLGHRNIIKAFFDLGFNSSQIIDIRTSLTYRDLFIRQLKKYLPHSKNDIAVAKINLIGFREGKKISREYEVYLESDENVDISAMITVTSQSAVTTAMLIAENKLSGVGGVFTPETALPKDDYINRMREHGVNIEITECEV